MCYKVGMSFHEELKQLNPERLGAALSAIYGKAVLEPGGRAGVDYALEDHYTELSVMPDCIAEAFERRNPDIDAEQLQTFRAGVLFLASVLCEYAQLETMDARFPDASDLG